MAKARTVVGLDVHATKIVAAVLDAEAGQLQMFGMSGESTTAAAFCAGLPRPVRVAYEAGPTGYGLARELSRRGVECVVAAPSKIPRASGDRVKTDRRDAEHLVRLLFAGKLHAVRVPGPEEEALRDLVRAREAVRLDLMRSRHRLSKLLLRHGIRFDDGKAWTDVSGWRQSRCRGRRHRRHRIPHCHAHPRQGRTSEDYRLRHQPAHAGARQVRGFQGSRSPGGEADRGDRDRCL